MAAPRKIDYDRIEADWRAGLLSPQQIAAKYTEETGVSVSRAAIIKHFTAKGIARDLSQKIHDRASAMVTEAMVTGKVSAQPSRPDREIIEMGSMQVAEVRLSHRKDAARARELVNAMLSELEEQTNPETRALLGRLGEMMRQPDERGADRLNDAYQAIISLPERSKTLKVLAESLARLIDIERQAFGMDRDRGLQPGMPGHVPPVVKVVHVSPQGDQQEGGEA